MEKDLRNKLVVVTGGAEGIGYAIADQFLVEGARTVILLDLNKIKGENAASILNSKHGDGKVVFIACDVTKDLEVVSKKIFEQYKQVDVLVNNAGVLDESSARRTFEINTIALVEWSMKFLEYMRKDKGGSGGTIVNVGSIYSYTVDPYLVFYKTSKFAVMGFTRSLGHANNFAKFGVRIVVICPGFTNTSLADKLLCWEEQATEFAQFIKTQAWQEIKDVGKAAVDVFKVAESGSAWKINGGKLAEIIPVAEGDHLR